MTKSACAYSSAGHHSADILEVWHGRVEPTYLCGFHEQQRGLPGSTKARVWAETLGEVQ